LSGPQINLIPGAGLFFEPFPVCPYPILVVCGVFSPWRKHFAYRLPPTEETPRENRTLVTGPGTTEPLGRGLPRAHKNYTRSVDTLLKLLYVMIHI
jgi:hypothetical protein